MKDIVIGDGGPSHTIQLVRTRNCPYYCSHERDVRPNAKIRILFCNGQGLFKMGFIAYLRSRFTVDGLLHCSLIFAALLQTWLYDRILYLVMIVSHYKESPFLL